MGVHCTFFSTSVYEIFHHEKLGEKGLMTKPCMNHYKNIKKVLEQSILDDQLILQHLYNMQI